eukprot:3654747-Amphidinium_carterae.1
MMSKANMGPLLLALRSGRFESRVDRTCKPEGTKRERRSSPEKKEHQSYRVLTDCDLEMVQVCEAFALSAD